MSYTFSTDTTAIDWAALKTALHQDMFCNGRTPEEYKLSAEGSHLSVYVHDGEKIVGNGRILSDGICNAYIVDIWTASQHRRQGIATRIVEILCESVPGQHIYLQTDDAMELYEKCGFSRQDFGLSRVVGSWLNR